MAWGSSDLFVAQDMGLLEEESNDVDAAARRRWRPASARPVRDHREMGQCDDVQRLALTWLRRFLAILP